MRRTHPRTGASASGVDPLIRRYVADVLPVSLVDHDGADRSGRLPDHLHEDGNDRFDLPRRQTPEEPFLHHVDPREEAAPDTGIPEDIAEIADLALRVEADVPERAVAPEGEGDLPPACRMGRQEPLQGKIGEDVAVVDEDRLVVLPEDPRCS